MVNTRNQTWGTAQGQTTAFKGLCFAAGIMNEGKAMGRLFCKGPVSK
jgi:hypothetical protein